MPCKLSDYKLTINYYDKDIFSEMNKSDRNKSLSVFVAYGTTNVEWREERLMYDVVALIYALGGSIGLFLGFSCLSVLLFAVEAIETKAVLLLKP
jgi:hypothetical protein